MISFCAKTADSASFTAAGTAGRDSLRLPDRRLSIDSTPEVGSAARHDFGRIAVRAATPAAQTKLTINEPGDRYEREADRMADAVMRMTAPGDREDADLGEALTAPRIQRKCSACEKEEELQRPSGTAR